MIRRTFDAKLFDEVINHPEVRPWIGGPSTGWLSLAAPVRDPANFALQTEGGGFLLVAQGEGRYEVHSMFLPEARRHSIKAMRSGFEYIFTRTDCVAVLTQVPDNNPAAAALARFARFRPMFRREDTPRGPTAFVGLTIDEWAQDTAGLEADGDAFHDFLREAKKAVGSELPEHPHDGAHERAVGATMRMVKAGNAEKAVAFYNRWAAFAGYVPLKLISKNPLTIDVSDAILEWSDGRMEVVLCR